MTEMHDIEEKQYKNGAIHDGQCDGKECGGVFICPQCKRLCGWCFGGAPDQRCDACVTASKGEASGYQKPSVDFALDNGEYTADADRILMGLAKAKLYALAKRFVDV